MTHHHMMQTCYYPAIDRTFPTHNLFITGSKHQVLLFQLLMVYARYNKAIGYCQGKLYQCSVCTHVYIHTVHYLNITVCHILWDDMVLFRDGLCGCSSADVHGRGSKRGCFIDDHCHVSFATRMLSCVSMLSMRVEYTSTCSMIRASTG